MANPFIQKLSYGQGKAPPQAQTQMPQVPQMANPAQAPPQSNYALGGGQQPAQPQMAQPQSPTMGMSQQPPARMNLQAGTTPRPYNPMDLPTDDAGWAKLNQMYDFTNPTMALQNALMDLGYNPMSANPFLRNLMKSASGLGQAFLQNRAMDPNATADPNYAAHTGANFRNFLAANIQNGSIYGTLGQAAQQMPQVVQAMRGYSDQLAQGMPVTQLNPFMSTLYDQMGSGMGQGTVNAMSNLRSPMMAAPMANAYRTGLGNQLVTALRQMGPNDDVWRYLLGF